MNEIIEKDYECLMIKTKDKRKFFTHKVNLPQIIEFSKIFHTEIATVEVKNAEVLDLIELAPAFCNSNYKSTGEYKIINDIYPNKRNRKDILNISSKIRDFIKNKLEENKKVTLNELKDHFKDEKLTTGCFCNHLRFIKEELLNTGINFTKVDTGTYCIE